MQTSRPAIRFQLYTQAHRLACLALFDANCPEFFAPNERADYAAFLDDPPAGYEVCVLDGVVVGAAGLVANAEAGRAGINWILFDPAVQGRGLGTALMERLLGRAREKGVGTVEIAASHKSAPRGRGGEAHRGRLGAGDASDRDGRRPFCRFWRGLTYPRAGSHRP